MIYRNVIQSLLAIVLALLLGCKPRPVLKDVALY